MPLILAIEPDRRQASQLSAVVRKRLHADLVLAETAERAFAELGSRVPDLILTAPLLSPSDEAMLGERLRAFDGAAAHVQTLTIPVLSSGRPRVRGKSGGVLSALGLGKAQDDAAPDGCDPSVFAAQCEEYLQRVQAERALHAPIVDDHEPLVVERHAPPKPAVKPPAVEEFVEPEPIAAAPEPPARFFEPEQVVVPEPVVAEPRPANRIFTTEQAPGRDVSDVFARIEAFAQSIAALDSDAPEELARAADVLESSSSRPIARREPEPERDVPDAFIELDLSEFLEEAPANTGKKSKPRHQDDDADDVYDISGSDADSFDEAVVPLVVKKSAPKPVAKPSKGVAAKPSAPPKAAAKSAPGKPGVREEREAFVPNRLGASQLWPAMDGVAAETPVSSRDESAAVSLAQVPSPRGQTRHKPIQDEWGFFDPEQCGFAALLAKLEEIIDDDHHKSE